MGSPGAVLTSRKTSNDSASRMRPSPSSRLTMKINMAVRDGLGGARHARLPGPSPFGDRSALLDQVEVLEGRRGVRVRAPTFDVGAVHARLLDVVDVAAGQVGHDQLLRLVVDGELLVAERLDAQALHQQLVDTRVGVVVEVVGAVALVEVVHGVVGVDVAGPARQVKVEVVGLDDAVPERAELLDVDRHVDAYLRRLELHDLRDLGADRVLVGVEAQGQLARLVAGLAEEFASALRVVREALYVLVEPLGVGADHAHAGKPDAQEYAVYDRLTVEQVGERLAHAHVLQTLGGVLEAEIDVAGAGRAADGEAVVLLEAGEVDAVDLALEQVDLAGFEGQEARGVLRDGPEHDPVDLGAA